METYNLPPNHFINIIKLTKVKDIASKEVEIKIQQFVYSLCLSSCGALVRSNNSPSQIMIKRCIFKRGDGWLILRLKEEN